MSICSDPTARLAAPVPLWREIGARELATYPLPHISVIVPFHDPRGHPDNLMGWTQEQLLEGTLFEVIVAIDGTLGPKVEQELRRHLRPQDRLLAVDEQGPFAAYAAGADAARGSILFFTEDHCVAQAGCLAAVQQHFETTEDSGASVHWGHINNNDVARMEELLSHIDAKQWLRPDHWNKVRIRGFAVRRTAYLDAGGFDWPYAEFSEAVLAARLHSRDHRVGHVAQAGVLHINSESLSEIQKDVWAYSWGECSYCDKHDPTFCDDYFSASMVLGRDTLVPPRLAYWMALALLKVMLRDRAQFVIGKSSLWGAVAAIARLVCLPAALRLRRLVAWPCVWSARGRFYLWRFHDTRRFRAFCDFWRRVGDAARIAYATKYGRYAANSPALQAADAAEFLVAGGPGCFPIERFKGRTFRWTGPAAVIPFLLPAGNHQLIIDTGGFRGSKFSFPFGVYWNRRLIPRKYVRCKHGVISIKVKRRMCRTGLAQELTIAAAPAIRSHKDRRMLGLPICSLQVVSADGDGNLLIHRAVPTPGALGMV
jgi:hypothetical protein